MDARFFETLNARRFHVPIHGFAAHYYCGGEGTDVTFTDPQWYGLLEKACRMERLVVQQRAIMDGFDPDRAVGLLVDEWGAWHSNAGSEGRPMLWQQCTIRDALVAALTLDIFNRHADKVIMANPAQTLNVLQSVILTDGPRMVRTPTYHVYALYADHQGAASVLLTTQCEEIEFQRGQETHSIPALAGSASLKERKLTLTVVNASACDPVEATVKLCGGARAAGARALVLTHGDIRAHNTFEEPQTVQPRAARVAAEGPEFPFTFAPASVTKLALDVR